MTKEIPIPNPKSRLPATRCIRPSGLVIPSPFKVLRCVQSISVCVGSVLAERGIDGSRGLQPTVGRHQRRRRGATAERTPRGHPAFRRRSATQDRDSEHRGLKPTATVVRSLRDLKPLAEFHSVHRNQRRTSFAAFTLLELLIVLAIIGLLSAVALPHLKGLTRSNTMASANQQLLDDLASARQRAINNRSGVYVLFMPPVDPAALSSLSRTQQNRTVSMQYTSYALFAERTAGDQPGRPYKRYITDWKTLPDGVFIAANKFSTPYTIPLNGVNKDVLPFDTNVFFPYPTIESSYSNNFAYLKFDAQGRLASTRSSDGTCTIPLARGSILLFTDPSTGVLTASAPAESGGNNSANTNTYDHIEIDGLTGRARLDRRGL